MSKLNTNCVCINTRAADASNRSKISKARLLASCSVLACSLFFGTDAQANDYTLDGGPAITILSPIDPAILTAQVPVVTIDAAHNGQLTVNSTTAATSTIIVTGTGSIDSAGYGIYGLAMTSNITTNIAGSVTAVGNGVTLDSRFAPDGGSVTLNGAGSATSTGAAAVWLLADTNTGGVTLDGLTGGINGATWGVLVNSNGTWVNSAGGDVNIGQTTPLGAVTAGGIGIEVIQQANAFGDGKINITTTDVTAVGYGIHTLGWTADTNISVTGALKSTGDDGIYATSTTGALTADGKGSGTINSLAIGIILDSATGNSTVQQFASITSTGDDGIWVPSDGGNILIQNNGPITGLADGIITSNTTGSTIINGNGFIHSTALFGIDAGSTSGAITITNNNGIKGDAGDGVWAHSLTGAITIDNNKDITGSNNGIVATSNGNIGVNGNGVITGAGVDGVYLDALGSNVNFGRTAYNGAVTGASDGINLFTTGTGIIELSTNANVTGTGGFGIYARNLNGALGLNIDAATVSGGVTGIDAASLGTGPGTINVAAPAVVEGGTWGLVTGSTGDTMTVTNAGIIRTIGDTGAASDARAGKVGIWAFTGNTVVNNAGVILGEVDVVGATSFLMNNNTGGVWTPSAGVSDFATANDTVNNAGLINTRTGNTTFAGLEAFNNKAGGIIDMTYGGSGAAANAKDSLIVQNFSPLAGSTVKFNVDFTQANSVGTEALANDHSSTGLGTADTIVVLGAAHPQAASIVDLALWSSAATGSSGSIALVNAVAGGLADPGPGGFATMIASSNYVFAADPSTGAVVYRLVDDGNGGVHLQWAPNVSATSLGGFGGATSVGAVSPVTGRSDGATAGEAIASVSAAMGGVGGMGLSGGPTGGGAAGRIGDLAASGVQLKDGPGAGDPTQQSGSLKDGPGPQAPACSSRRGRTAWGQGEASRYRFSGNADGGNAENISGGLDTDLGNVTGRDCDRVAVGIFGYTSWSDLDFANTSAVSENHGFGGYIRLSSASGFYAALVGSWNWDDQKVVNKVIGSTANRERDGFSGVAIAGYNMPINVGAALDFRGFVGYGSLDGGAFTDSAGFVISGSEDDLVTVGGSVGFHVALNSYAQTFVRSGVKWAKLDSSITAFGITQSGSAEEVSGSVAAGLVISATDGVQVGVSGFGEFSDSADNYGARAHINVNF